MTTDNNDNHMQQFLRVSDISQEPHEMLMPITGYEDVPLESLENAVEPLVHLLPKVQSFACAAKEKCKKPPADGLTLDESAAIMLYSMGWKPHDKCLYIALNATLRSRDREKLQPWFLYLKLFLTALSRIPSKNRFVFRGVKQNLRDQYPKGATITWWGFSSCTTSIEVLQSEIFLEQPEDLLEISDQDLKLEDEIGRGAFGTVYRAQWLSRHHTVAVKKLHLAQLDVQAKNEFYKELLIMHSLRYPHIVTFIGACMENGKYALVMEYMSLGSLYKILHRDNLPLDWSDRLSIALQTAKSINYLHKLQPSILHRDIKSLNFLLEKSHEGYFVKVCDFGLAQTRSETTKKTQLTDVLFCTFQWTAPEVLVLKAYTDKSDIYSLGVVYWELSTNEIPYAGHQNDVISDFAKFFTGTTIYRFNSYVPPRENQLVHWFINGKSYMEAVAKALLKAKEEVFIADRWLSPELMLIRPTEDDTFRLDNILGRIADAGVRVYVLLSGETQFAIPFNNSYAEKVLMSKSKNGFIKVIRHPNRKSLFRLHLWSHHEKMVIIDQKIAFVGGIDLCFGRWDDEHMRLVDLGAENITTLESSDETIAENIVANISLEAAQQATTQTGEKSTKNLRKIYEDNADTEIVDKQKSSITDSAIIDRKQRMFIGKDYSNLYEKDFEALDRYDEDYIDRKTIPRTPWHDEALVVFGQTARDVARHFIQRWNNHKLEHFPKDDFYPSLLLKSYNDEEDSTVCNWKDFLKSKPFHVQSQCVRSVGPWSVGMKTVEFSIQNAYIRMIDVAKYYIYIENQCFISIAQDSTVHNQLAEALFKRIHRAHILNEKFRIYIVLPLLPGFQSISAVQAVLYFIMRSITKGDSSLFKRLERAGISPMDYISFFGMRTHDILMSHLVSEVIFVNSKLMIIDDRIAICGSANINDRSLLGQRDSELCVIINDLEEEEGRLNGQTVRVGKCCFSWRKKLFEMLLGIQFENPYNIDVTDPISDEFYFYFRHVARTNTLIYEEVFSTMPTDCEKNFDQVSEYMKKPKMKDTDPRGAQQKLKDIQGLVVEYPIHFLEEENYLPSLRTREGMAPTVVWT
ncbi:unnamed protein product [Rotaria sp. Silwood1]|nr:unnamed protein product [Rotaria sp. Silwood1]